MYVCGKQYDEVEERVRDLKEILSEKREDR